MESVAVRVRDCLCPGLPHGEEGDLVLLAPTLSLAGGLQAEADIINAGGDGKMLARQWLVTFVRSGAVGWNWLDADGPIPFDVDVILADYALASPVAEKGDELYGAAVMRPLLVRLKMLSPRGPTAGSTSRPLQSIPSPHKRSSRVPSAASKRSA